MANPTAAYNAPRLTLTIVEMSAAPPLYALIAHNAQNGRQGVYDYFPTFAHALSAATALYQDPTIINWSYDTSRPHSMLIQFTSKRTHIAPAPQYFKARFSARAWQNTQQEIAKYGYNGSATTTGPTHYWAALLKANPSPAHFQDARPDWLKDADYDRIPKGQLPVWCEGDTDEPRNTIRLLNHAKFNPLILPLLILASRFSIAPLHGHISARSAALAVIEAIALDYLHPQNPPQYNPRPVGASGKKDYHNYKKSRYEFSY